VNWDMLTNELWSVLLTGGRSVLARQQLLTAHDIMEYVQRDGVNTLGLPTPLYNLIAEIDVNALRGLKYLLTGGETASVKHVRRGLEQLPETRLVNGYGPSECTVFASCYVAPPDLPKDTASLPIGKPIGDRRLYVLDDWMRPAPVGVVGEAYIGGPSVARRYLQRAELTAERCVSVSYSATG